MSGVKHSVTFTCKFFDEAFCWENRLIPQNEFFSQAILFKFGIFLTGLIPVVRYDEFSIVRWELILPYICFRTALTSIFTLKIFK